MRILVITESLRHGGAETMAVNLANALAGQGNKIVMALAASPGPLNDRLSPAVDFFPLARPGLASIPANILALRRLIHAFSPDIIHSQGATLAVLARLASPRKNRPAIVLTHHLTKFNRLPPSISAFLVNHTCDRVIAIAAHKLAEFLKSGVSRSRLTLIPNFLDTAALDKTLSTLTREKARESLGIPPNNRVVSVICRLIPGKGVDTFIASLVQASSLLPEPVTGLIVGDGPDRTRLERLVQNTGRGELFRFSGYRNDTATCLLASDAVLFPSREEVLPMLLIEALAVGVPVVCSSIPGNREVVEAGVSGLIAEESPDSYARAICSILDDPSLASRLSANGRRSARERFSKETVVPRIMELYSSVLAGPAVK